MATFSRRGASDDSESPAEPPVPVTDAAQPPAVNISVQAFRGMGSEAGPAVSIGADPAPAETPPAEDRPLPLAPMQPPAQVHTDKVMADNILLREALARLGEDPTNDQLLGVFRQMLQGHLILRVHGEAQEQIARGEPLQVSVMSEGQSRFLLAFSSAAALHRVLAKEPDPRAFSAVAQSVTTVLNQVITGGFSGLILDNASAPHRAIFPAEVITRAMAEIDPGMRIKALLARPSDAGTEAAVAEALLTTRVWVAASMKPNGDIGVAQVQTEDGDTYLQLFTHPLEVVALGRGDRPLPFAPEQLAQTLAAQPRLSGVLIDPAGPTLAVRREALSAVEALAGR